MMSRFIFLMLFLLVISISSAQEVTKYPFEIGETLEFFSKALDEKRKVNIYLPPYYAQDSLASYPVIYLLDGAKEEDFIHVSGLVQFATFPWIEMMPESIVVGIANVDRKRDFTYPTTIEKDKIDFPTSGRSEIFIDFIEKELQPLINDKYRCAAEKTIIGQSLGGLLATELLFKKANLFDNYIIVSPSLWWDDGSLFEAMPDDVGEDKSIFIAVGKEGAIMEGDAMSLYAQILKRKTKSTRVFFKFLEDQDHGDALHLALYEAFSKIYEKEK